MPSSTDLHRYMLIWLIRNTVRQRMGLELTKYEHEIPSNTQYSKTVRKLISEDRLRVEAGETYESYNEISR